MNFAIGTTVAIVFMAAAVYTASVPLALGGITSGIKTVSIAVKDGFEGNVRNTNEFLGVLLSDFTGGILFAGMTVAFRYYSFIRKFVAVPYW